MGLGQWVKLGDGLLFKLFEVLTFHTDFADTEFDAFDLPHRFQDKRTAPAHTKCRALPLSRLHSGRAARQRKPPTGRGGGGGSAGPAVLTCREASVSPLLEDWRDGRRPGGGVEAAEVLPRGPRC